MLKYLPSLACTHDLLLKNDLQAMHEKESKRVTYNAFENEAVIDATSSSEI